MIILVKYGEIHLKGKNKGYFERQLILNLKNAVSPALVQKIEGRLLITNFDSAEQTAEKARKVFGVTSVAIATEVPTSQKNIIDFCSTIKLSCNTFKVEVNRADKSFEMPSPELARTLGGVILKKNTTANVDVKTPQQRIYVDIRENKNTYVYTQSIKGVGGMPVGTAGSAMLLLSGGIDSPVAAYYASKRGLSLSAVHFTTPPYTSGMATEKVKTLAKKLTAYCGNIKLFIVPFTEQMMQIKNKCDSSYTITLMRRLMVRIAEKLCLRNRIDTIVTGENLAQVASQTIQGITTNNACAEKLPILRPLICFDKEEIIEVAKKIDTFNTSIINHQDCCTVFVPKNPSIQPTLKKCEEEEQKIDVNQMVQDAIASAEKVLVTVD